LSEASDRKPVPTKTTAKNVAHVEPSQKKPSLSESFVASEQVQKIKKAVSLSRTNSENRPTESVHSRFKSSIHSLIKFYETSVTHKKPVVLEDKNLHDQGLASLEDGHSVCTAASGGHLSQLSQLSAERLQSWLSNPLPSVDSKDFSLMEVDVLDQYVTDMLSFTMDIDTPRSSVHHEGKVHLKSNEELLDLLNDVQQSEEASQCLKISVQDMISRIEASSDIKSSQQQLVILTKSEEPPSEEDLNRGVFTEVSFAGTFAPQKLQQKTSFSNSFKQAKLVIDNKPQEVKENLPAKSKPEVPVNVPVPSPRLKKKARKELMLMEHKEKGKEALSKLVKTIQQPQDQEEQCQTKSIPNQKVGNGSKVVDGPKVINGGEAVGGELNSLIDDLCALSAGVVRDVAEDRRLSKTLTSNRASKENVDDKKSSKTLTSNRTSKENIDETHKQLITLKKSEPQKVGYCFLKGVVQQKYFLLVLKRFSRQ
jgi:hypothetical protein